MAVIVYTPQPAAVLAAVRTEITSGRVVTWSLDSDGDFTHSPEQWRLKAWFRPQVLSDRLVFRILTPQKVDMNKLTYAVYHGRLIEMLLSHFDMQFRRVEATALPAEGDRVKG